MFKMSHWWSTSCVSWWHHSPNLQSFTYCSCFCDSHNAFGKPTQFCLYAIHTEIHFYSNYYFASIKKASGNKCQGHAFIIIYCVSDRMIKRRIMWSMHLLPTENDHTSSTRPAVRSLSQEPLQFPLSSLVLSFGIVDSQWWTNEILS